MTHIDGIQSPNNSSRTPKAPTPQAPKEEPIDTTDSYLTTTREEYPIQKTPEPHITKDNFDVSKKTTRSRPPYILITILAALITVLIIIFASTLKIYQTAKAMTTHATAPSIIQRTPDQQRPPQQKPPTVLAQIATSLVHQDEVILKGEKEERINILLLGIGGEGHSGAQLTDTIMVASFNPTTKDVGLLSIPRDLYTEVPELQQSMKINTVMQEGESTFGEGNGIPLLQNTIEQITGISIHYFIQIDFQGFEQMVDTLGGITITLNSPIDDPKYPGPNFSYERFAIAQGTHTLDGATALKVARSRHTTKGGDFGRAQRQQDILQAIKDKTQNTFQHFQIATISKLLDIFQDHIRTDMTLYEMKKFYELSKEIEAQNISNAVISTSKPYPYLQSSKNNIGRTKAYTLTPRLGKNEYLEIHFLARYLFHTEQTEAHRQQIQQEQPVIHVYTQNKEQQQTASLISQFLGYQGFQATIYQTQQQKDTPQHIIQYTQSKPSSTILLQMLFPNLEIIQQQQTSPAGPDFLLVF